MYCDKDILVPKFHQQVLEEDSHFIKLYYTIHVYIRF